MCTPFVYLFESPNHKYCFDVHTNEILMVEEDLYNLLFEWVATNQMPSEKLLCNSQYKQLLDQGYLLRSRPREIEHPVSPYLETYLSRGVKLIILQVTQDCNFRCKYCSFTSGAENVQRKHNNRKMSWETAKMAVDYLAVHSIDEVLPGISFYGGEPLLEFELIKKTVEYAKERFAGRSVTFNTTVNGSLLTPEKCMFLQENNFRLLVSLDGDREGHDRNRVFAENGKGTFDVVLSKLKMIVEDFPQLAQNTTINMVVDTEANDIIFDIAKLYPNIFPQIGVRGTAIDTTHLDDAVIDLYEDHDASNRYVLQDALAILSLLGKDFSDEIAYISKEHIKRCLTKIAQMSTMKKLPEKTAPSGPCIAGGSRLFITSEGKLLPCERVSETNDAICLGKIETGVCVEKAYQFINVAQMTAQKCANCFAFRYCNVCGRVCCSSETETAKLQEKNCQGARAYFAFILKLKVLLQEAAEIYDKKVFW